MSAYLHTCVHHRCSDSCRHVSRRTDRFPWCLSFATRRCAAVFDGEGGAFRSCGNPSALLLRHSSKSTELLRLNSSSQEVMVTCDSLLGAEMAKQAGHRLPKRLDSMVASERSRSTMPEPVSVKLQSATLTAPPFTVIAGAVLVVVIRL